MKPCHRCPHRYPVEPDPALRGGVFFLRPVPDRPPAAANGKKKPGREGPGSPGEGGVGWGKDRSLPFQCRPLSQRGATGAVTAVTGAGERNGAGAPWISHLDVQIKAARHVGRRRIARGHHPRQPGQRVALVRRIGPAARRRAHLDVAGRIVAGGPVAAQGDRRVRDVRGAARGFYPSVLAQRQDTKGKRLRDSVAPAARRRRSGAGRRRVDDGIRAVAIPLQGPGHAGEGQGVPGNVAPVQ